MTGSDRKRGSIAVTNKLTSTQRKVTKTIVGSLSTAASDVLDVHAQLLPVDLLFHEILFKAALWLSTLPHMHLPHSVVRHTAHHQVKHYCSLIHNLLYTTGVNPHKFETIAPIRHIPSYRLAIECIISDDKEVALQVLEKNYTECKYKIYCNSSSFKNKIGASTLLYTSNQLTKTLHFNLGLEDKHMVYEAKSVGLLMGIHLLKGLNVQMQRSVVLGSDSQVLNRALSNQNSHPGQYLIDKIHNSTEQLHLHQHSLINADEKQAACRTGKTWKGCTHNVINLQLHWISSHSDFKPNERADEEVKLTSQGRVNQAPTKAMEAPLEVLSTLRWQVGDLKRGGRQVSIAGVMVQVWKQVGKPLLSKGMHKESNLGVAQPQVPPPLKKETHLVCFLMCPHTTRQEQNRRQAKGEWW